MRWPILFLVLVTTAARAESGNFYTDRPLDFSLGFSHRVLTLDYGGSGVDTDVDRVGVTWRERFSERLQLGLVGGYSVLTQTDNPPTAGLELDGYHAGFLVDLQLLTLQRVGVLLRGTWLYEKMDHDDGMQKVSVSWREPSAELGVRGEVGSLRVYGGLRYGAIDGQQRLSGVLNETRTIKQTDRTGGYAGLELGLDDSGYVGVSAASGIDRSVTLYFGRLF